MLKNYDFESLGGAVLKDGFCRIFLSKPYMNLVEYCFLRITKIKLKLQNFSAKEVKSTDSQRLVDGLR